MHLVGCFFAGSGQRQKWFRNSGVFRPIVRPVGEGADGFVLDGFILIAHSGFDGRKGIRPANRRERSESDPTSAAIGVFRQRQNVRQALSSAPITNRKHSFFHIVAFIADLRFLKQAHQTRGLGGLSHQANGLQGCVANSRVGIFGAAHDDRNGGGNPSLSNHFDQRLACRPGGLWQASDKIFVHSLCLEPRQRSFSAIGYFDVALPGRFD